MNDIAKAGVIAVATIVGLLAIAWMITPAQAKAAELLGGPTLERPITVETIINSMCIVVRSEGIQYCPMSKNGICKDGSIICAKKKKG